LIEDRYGGANDLACRRCQLSRHPDFPLASKTDISCLLGWSDAQPKNGTQATAFGRG
jgi:hypothetical protein